MIIKQLYIPDTSKARTKIPLNHPTSITLHWIGPYPTHVPEGVRNWWMNSGNNDAAHFVIKDKVCVQAIPEHEVAWHCGCNGNYTSLGIELIPMNIAGQFSSDTIDTLIDLLKHLPHIALVRHFDWTSKDCPRYYTPKSDTEGGAARWIAFQNMLYEARKEI